MNIRGQKKVILLSAAGFVAVIAITIIVLTIVAPRDLFPNDDSTSPSAVGETACTVVTRAAVERAINGKIPRIHETIAAGQGELPNKDTVDVCVYPFSDDATVENNYRLDNSLSVEIYRHVDQASVQSFKETRGASAKNITGLSKEATFKEVPFSDGSMRYELFVYSDTIHYTFRIGQPKGSAAFNAASAENALTSLARSVSF